MKDEGWPDLCKSLARIIRDLYPWWFDGSEGSLGLTRIQHLDAVKWMGEECCICDQNIGGQGALMATFERRFNAPVKMRASEPEWEQPDKLIFFAHPACISDSGRVTEDL